MKTRQLVAMLVLLASVAAILWVTLGGDDTDAVAEANTVGDANSAPAASSDSPNDPDRPASSDSTATDSTAPNQTAPTQAPEPAIDPPENFGPRMDLVDIDGWLNTDATSIDDFNGQVVLVEMWTFGCHNCKARIPFNQSYYEEFAGENFEIVGVHAPEFSFEADVTNIENALVDLGVTWPVALDTEKLNFRAWQPGRRNFWPRTYVIDQNGDIRYDHIGEGKYEELRETIRYLLENPPPSP